MSSVVDRASESYQGKVKVATVDASQEAGIEIGKRYDLGAGIAIAYFDRKGELVKHVSGASEQEVREMLDKLLAEQ